MIAITYVEIQGKVYAPGDSLPGLSKSDEAWLLEGGYAKAGPKAKAAPKAKVKQEKKTDDVQGSGK